MGMVGVTYMEYNVRGVRYCIVGGFQDYSPKDIKNKKKCDPMVDCYVVSAYILWIYLSFFRLIGLEFDQTTINNKQP